MQINSQPKEIIIYFWKQKVAICVVDEFDQYKSNYIRELRLELWVKFRVRVC